MGSFQRKVRVILCHLPLLLLLRCSKALNLSTIVDDVKHSLFSPALSESHRLSQAERLTGLSSGPTKGNFLPSTTSE